MESTIHLRGEGDTVTVKVAPDLASKLWKSLRQDLLAALGEEMPLAGGRGLKGDSKIPESEVSWRRGWNAKRQSMLEAINRLLPPEEG